MGFSLCSFAYRDLIPNMFFVHVFVKWPLLFVVVRFFSRQLWQPGKNQVIPVDGGWILASFGRKIRSRSRGGNDMCFCFFLESRGVADFFSMPTKIQKKNMYTYFLIEAHVT